MRRCVGTDARGSATSERRPASAKSRIGRVTGTGPGASVSALNSTTSDAVVAVWFRAEVAQQLSACSWVTTRFESDRCDADLCIGQVVSSVQHAMRASGVAFQPAHTARFPVHSASIAASAAKRRLKISTRVGCWTGASVSSS
jgi:hypothetical protein